MSRNNITARRLAKRQTAPVTAKATARPLAAQLGIRCFSVTHQRVGNLGDPVNRPNGNISLSGGDGADFSAWWRVACQPLPAPLQCRSPEGCAKPRREGRSYCAAHAARYRATRPPPGGRPLLICVAPNRRQKRLSPRLDLVDG